jgi:hypothetical protein
MTLVYKNEDKMKKTVIDFSSSGPVAHGQWKLIRTSDLCQFFSIESIEISPLHVLQHVH